MLTRQNSCSDGAIYHLQIEPLHPKMGNLFASISTKNLTRLNSLDCFASDVVRQAKCPYRI